MSVHNMAHTLYGIVHSFILDSHIKDPDALSPLLYVRRIIQYLHTNLVVNPLKSSGNLFSFYLHLSPFMTIFADDDYHHLLTFEDIKDDSGTIIKHGIDDARSLISLFNIAIFMNALDKRTYQPYTQSVSPLTQEELRAQREMDLNAIPLIERRHCCYIRGLVFDLLGWFQNHYKMLEISGEVAEITDMIPTAGDFGQRLVQYKRKATDNGIPGVCTYSAFKRQVEMALFQFEGMEEMYKELFEDHQSDEMRARYAEGEIDLILSLDSYRLEAYSTTQDLRQPITDYFKAGKNRADNIYFYGLAGMFVLTNWNDN
jgi:hypothetical protein